jgi:hypothetical protein
MSEVHPLRNTYGADEVILLVSYPSSSYCGIAYLMDPAGSYFAGYAFAVVRHRIDSRFKRGGPARPPLFGCHFSCLDAGA